MADTLTAPAPAAAQAATPNPASRPASPAAPARTSAPSAPARDMNDAFSQLDKLGTDEPADESRPAPRNQRQQDKPVDKAQEQPQPTEQKTQAKSAEEGFPDSEKATKMRAGELSRHYKALKAAHDALIKKQVEMSSKPVDIEKLTRLEAEAKANHDRWEKAQEEIRFSKYERSQEYAEKYWKPYEKAFREGAQKVSGLTVIARTNEDTGEVIQAARQATKDDFQKLMTMVNDDEAAGYAEQLFGPVKAALVLSAREKALSLNETRLEALEEYRVKGGEIERQRQEAATASAREIDSIYEREKNAAVEKHPIWFKPDGDAKGDELLQKGMEWVDAAYTGRTKDENGNIVPLTPQQKAMRHSAIRNKAAAFDRIVYRNRNLMRENAELKKKLEGYDASEPGAESPRKEKRMATGSAMDQVLAGMGS